MLSFVHQLRQFVRADDPVQYALIKSSCVEYSLELPFHLCSDLLLRHLSEANSLVVIFIYQTIDMFRVSGCSITACGYRLYFIIQWRMDAHSHRISF